jgi:hypothetical protein
VALNPFTDYRLSYVGVTFKDTGRYIDSVLAPHYFPSVTPTVSPTPLNTVQQSIESDILNTALTPYSVGTDWNFRVRHFLRTSDARYTPFLFGYEVQFPAVRNPRPLPSLTVYDTVGNWDSIQKLEFTEQDDARFEGTLAILCRTDALKAIINRGAATYLLQTSTDGRLWYNYNGGIASSFKFSPLQGASGTSNADIMFTCKLIDMREFMKDSHVLTTGSMDGLTITQAVNRMLGNSGQGQLSSWPVEADYTYIPFPPAGGSWKFEAHSGETLTDYIDRVLLFLRRENVEYVLRYDWLALDGWVIEPKPRHTDNPWRIYSVSDYDNSVGNAWHYIDKNVPEISVMPPEANMLIIEGMLDPNQNKVWHGNDETQEATMTAPTKQRKSFRDVDSIQTVNSENYLGWMKMMKVSMFPCTDPVELDRMGRRILKMVDVRSRKATGIQIEIPKNNTDAVNIFYGLTRSTRVILMDNMSNVMIDGWIKVRHYSHGFDTVPYLNIELDTIWEGDMHLA